MIRITLIHWRRDEGSERAELLRAGGGEVTLFVPRDGRDLKRLWAHPPDLYVIDLDRRPADGRGVALLLRQRRASRTVPICFLGGVPEKVCGVRELLPDAEYASWRGVRGAVRRATARAARRPVAPGFMAPYASTPLVKKLGIREGATVLLLGAPADFEPTLGPLPGGVRLRRSARGRGDLVILFARSRSELARRLPVAVRSLEPRGGLWVTWPKMASGMASDLTQVLVRAAGFDAGLVDHKIARIDATWSALRFVRRAPRSRG